MMDDKMMAMLAADQIIRRGWYWVGGGLILSFATYAAADPGGGFVVFWGAPLYGLYRVYKGVQLKNELRKL